MLYDFKNKTVWITGCKRIGQTIAEDFAKAGANLILSYRSSIKEAEKIEKNVKKYKVKTLVLQCDVSKRESVEKAVKQISEKFKRLDILINMASVFTPVKFDEIKERDWENNIQAHIFGTFWSSQIASKIMPRGSHIINITDRTALGKIYSDYLPYVVTKSAVSTMTKALAVELAGKGIFVNAIAPGPILRPEDISEKDWHEIRNQSAIKFSIDDNEAVRQFSLLAMYLASITMASGHTYPLDQGQNL